MLNISAIVLFFMRVYMINSAFARCASSGLTAGRGSVAGSVSAAATVGSLVGGLNLKIKLNGNSGDFFLIDKEDYALVSKYKWYLDSKINYKRTRTNIGGRKNHKTISMHRLIMDFPEGKEVDHINGNALDNRRNNLRIVTHAENCQNSSKRKGNYKGVRLRKDRNKWIAQISKHHIGYFNSEIEAAKAYNKKAIELFGKDIRLNNIASEMREGAKNEKSEIIEIEDREIEDDLK